MDSLAILQRFGSGQLLEALATALTTTSAEVVETGKPGRVSVTFTITSEGQGDPMVVVTPSLARATPKRDVRAALFFAVDGGLYREDPRQIPLDFRTVDTATGELRDVPAERHERTVS